MRGKSGLEASRSPATMAEDAPAPDAREAAAWPRRVSSRTESVRSGDRLQEPGSSGGSVVRQRRRLVCGDLTKRQASFATCGGGPGNRDCGSPAAPSLQIDAIVRGSWRSRWIEEVPPIIELPAALLAINDPALVRRNALNGES